jgi:hypothetical protein
VRSGSGVAGTPYWASCCRSWPPGWCSRRC